jgi:hypothetical protein
MYDGSTPLLFAKTNCNRVYSLNVALRFYIPISHNRDHDSGVLIVSGRVLIYSSRSLALSNLLAFHSSLPSQFPLHYMGKLSLVHAFHVSSVDCVDSFLEQVRLNLLRAGIHHYHNILLRRRMPTHVHPLFRCKCVSLLRMRHSPLLFQQLLLHCQDVERENVRESESCRHHQSQVDRFQRACYLQLFHHPLHVQEKTLDSVDFQRENGMFPLTVNSSISTQHLLHRRPTILPVRHIWHHHPPRKMMLGWQIHRHPLHFQEEVWHSVDVDRENVPFDLILYKTACTRHCPHNPLFQPDPSLSVGVDRENGRLASPINRSVLYNLER